MARLADGRAGGSASLAALDPGRRSLSTWFGDVAEPPTKDTTGTARYLADLLQATMEAKTSLLMDFGAGGDTALLRLMREAPDLVSAMQTEGVTPVAFDLTGPRVDDLDAMVQLEAAGFQPKATAILLNEGRIPDPSVLPEDAFAGITAHSRYRQLLTRGAVSIWLPRLDFETMTEIESKRLHFGQARDGQVPEGATFPPIGGLKIGPVCAAGWTGWSTCTRRSPPAAMSGILRRPAGQSEPPPLAQPDPFAEQVTRAQQALDAAIDKAGLHRDPYRHVMEAWWAMLGLLPPLVQRIEAARQPVRDQELQRAVVAGAYGRARPTSSGITRSGPGSSAQPSP